MRTRLRKWSLLLGAAALLALPLASWAQLTTVRPRIRAWAWKATSAISPATPRMPSADYRRYCVGCHGDLGDGNGEVASGSSPRCTPSRATSSWAFSSAAPRPPEPCPPTRIFSIPSLAASTARICRSGAPFTKQQRADLVAWVKHFSPRWTNEKPGTPITIPPEPEVTPERIKAGRDVFATSAVLEVPRRAGHGQWPVRRHSHRRSRPADRCLSTLPKERGQSAAIPIGISTGFS